ncbi:hypothetical protein [Desulfitobacterium chlororespirans]|uniref:Uncharacterized protein n=1 Tax=Desulfitobacterium chlororespirans DSM 11544 TaxID=1121395 RepID=A0A1M7URS8_9FIRM|nr:hypothetical protein [Desulfitobacterium chlororespirans]SHN85659.1 hypothetical protein SAMN02745215_04460 [Desulfitobacterium chlororespirans DSM 11544]
MIQTGNITSTELSFKKDQPSLNKSEKESGVIKKETEPTVAKAEPATATEGTVTVGISFDGDTAEISEKGMQTAMSSSSQNEPSGNTELSQASSTVKTLLQDDSTADTDTSNLSQYSETQLKSMVSQGTITQSQYIKEMSSRAGKAEQ